MTVTERRAVIAWRRVIYKKNVTSELKDPI